MTGGISRTGNWLNYICKDNDTLIESPEKLKTTADPLSTATKPALVMHSKISFLGRSQAKHLPLFKNKNLNKMEIYKFIVFSVILLGWCFALPYLKKYKSYQFCALLFFSFATGILLTGSIQKNGWENKNIIFFLIMFGGIIYQAYKFYKENVVEN
jgi:hypothetical protein